jgi:hypothetical protein
VSQAPTQRLSFARDLQKSIIDENTANRVSVKSIFVRYVVREIDLNQERIVI